LRQLQRQNAGAVDPDIRAINRVVIDEDETVQPKIELLRERFDVVRFAVPIDAPRNQVLAFQEHIGSLVEDGQRIVFIVLAAQTEQHAGVHLTDHEFLQRAVRRGHFDSPRTILTANPFPERVVAVQHDHFERVSFQIEKGSDERCPDRGVTLRCVRDMTHMMTVWIVIVVDRIAPQQRRRTDGVNIRYSGRF